MKLSECDLGRIVCIKIDDNYAKVCHIVDSGETLFGRIFLKVKTTKGNILEVYPEDLELIKD